LRHLIGIAADRGDNAEAGDNDATHEIPLASSRRHGASIEIFANIQNVRPKPVAVRTW
jgi:hypothetical protein